MDNKRKVSRINNLSVKWKLNVAVYCRVSTTHTEQIESLSNQIEYYRKMVSTHIDWVIVDIYADIQSGKSSSGRPEFQRMLEDCRNKKIDLIITKSVSRFGRNTADILAVIHKLRLLNVDVFFEVENIRISETNKTFLLSIFEAVAQVESNTNLFMLVHHLFPRNNLNKSKRKSCAAAIFIRMRMEQSPVPQLIIA